MSFYSPFCHQFYWFWLFDVVFIIALRGRKLHSVMLELSSSEEVYLSGLDTLLNVYLLPISKAVRSSPPAGAGPIQQLLDDTVCFE